LIEQKQNNKNSTIIKVIYQNRLNVSQIFITKYKSRWFFIYTKI